MNATLASQQSNYTNVTRIENEEVICKEF
jgi:hypothetical protein